MLRRAMYDVGRQPCSWAAANKLFIARPKGFVGRAASFLGPLKAGRGLLNETLDAAAPWDRLGGASTLSAAASRKRIHGALSQ